MTVDLRRPRRVWLVIFHEAANWMRIVATQPAPLDPEEYAELDTELDAACLSSFRVEATSPAEARRCARQMRDIARIQDACTRTRQSDQPRRPSVTCNPAPGQQLLNRVVLDLALTPPAAERTAAIVRTAMRAAYRYRPVKATRLGFEQFVDGLTTHAAAVIHRHAALVATGRKDEAVAALVNGLNGARSDAW